MKKVLGLVFLCILYAKMVNAQVQMDFKTLQNWPQINKEGSLVSKNGKYFVYQTRELEYGSIKSSKWIVSDFLGNKIISLNASSSHIVGVTGDEKYLLVRMNNDSVKYINLSDAKTTALAGIKKIVIAGGGNDSKVIYQLNTGETFIAELTQMTKTSLGLVSDFRLLDDNRTVFMIFRTNDGKETWKFYDLATNKLDSHSLYGFLSSPIWSADYKKLALMEKDHPNRIWLLEKGKGLSTIALSNERELINKGMEIEKIEKINSNNSSIEVLLKTVEKPRFRLSEMRAKVNIHSYLDRKLLAEKPDKPSSLTRFYKALVFPLTGKIQLLEDGANTVMDMVNGWYVIDDDERRTLVNSKNGETRKLANLQEMKIWPTYITSDGNFMIYYYHNQYYRYDFSTKKYNLIDFGNQELVWHERHPLSENETGFYHPVDSRPVPLNNNLLRIRDQHDIWIIDVTGRKPPLCLTKEYGRKNKITFQVIRDAKGKDIFFKGKLMLKGFGIISKKSGFFTVDLSGKMDPEKLVYDDSVYDNVSRSSDGLTWFFSKESTGISPNYFLTRDFKCFTPLSNLYPEKQLNWYTSELIDGRLPDNRLVQALLYKPKNFNDRQKYPVIFHYYELRSDGKNGFRTPELSRGDIDYAWFLSRGYLIAEVDMIHYKQGYVGQSALDCLNAITDSILKMPYVDSNKLGLMGHSFGGLETLYFVTHSKRFAAALASAPLSNATSVANTLTAVFNGWELGRFSVEHFQYRLGSTMWEKPVQHLLNSPVFEADKVTTPLLMMHNTEDGNVPYTQGMEFFLSLRRLGRPCWLLEYEGEAHTIWGLENRKDYTLRTTQFFDHYLKDGPAPLWMIEGQKYQERKYLPGYELDTLGRKPGPGINSVEEQRKIDAYSKIPFLEKLRPLIEQKKN